MTRLNGTACSVYPPSAWIAFSASQEAPQAAAAAAARDSSYQADRSRGAVPLPGRPVASSGTARDTPTMTSGAIATTSTSESAIIAQASMTPAMTGMYQRRGLRSSSSHTARAGTAVPMCPTDSSSTKMPTPSCGANMMPPESRTRARPSRELARPLASSAARTTASV